MEYSLESLMKNDGFICPSCGRRHFGLLGDCIVGDNAIESLPSVLEKYSAKYPYVLCDINTYKAAGERVCAVLDSCGIKYFCHIIGRDRPAPDEKTVGEAFMFCPNECDSVVAVGGGVINDTGKIIAAQKHIPDIIIGTAPSMDGFASGTSSMERCGLKISLPTKCPDVVIGEPEILANAPKRMILSGIGDILAKYVSVVEWQIANILVGDYYCETIAEIVRASLKKCVDSAKAAVKGDKEAICDVMEGLVISGLAMNYAGISRPASGMEHYISHIIDMRALEFGTHSDLHGISCGTAALTVIRAYEQLVERIPDREKALAAVAAYDNDQWNEYLRAKLGHGAEAIIAGEEKEGKYDKAKHALRLEKIIENWDKIVSLAGQLPKSDELEAFMKDIGHPTTPDGIGVSETEWHEAFMMSKDIRDKYILGRLLWDLGITDIG